MLDTLVIYRHLTSQTLKMSRIKRGGIELDRKQTKKQTKKQEKQTKSTGSIPRRD